MSKRKQEKLVDSSGIFVSYIVGRLVIGPLVFVTLFSGFILSSTHAKADDAGNSVVDEVIAIVPTACSLSGTIANEHTATIIAGSYSEDIGTTNLKAVCNDFSGFSIYAAGFTGNTFSSGNTNMVGANTNQTIPTGTATSGDTSNWAMKLTKVTNPATGDPITYSPQNLTITTGYDDYHAVPSGLTKVVNYEAASGSSATDSILGANVETTYRIFMSPSQDSDTYNGKVKYILVHPATMAAGTYTIAYNANGGTGTMQSETVPNYEPHTLPNSTITPPSGYALAGWCTVQDTTASGVVQNADPQTTCTGDSYPNNGTLPASPSISATNGGTLTLYAMWRPLIVTWENNYSGTGLPANATTVINGPISTLPTPTKPGTQCNGVDCFASFKGWYTNAKGTGDPIAAGVAPTDDVTYYAIWNFNNNTLQATRNVATAEDGTNCAGTKYDARDGKAYNVNYITSGNSNFCFILSNLKVESGVTLKAGDSNITPNSKYSTFTTPTESWTTSSQNYYCKAIMAIVNGEYYYNWYTAIANPYQCSDPTTNTGASATNDGYSLGSICPAGWALPEDGSGELQIGNSTFRTALVNNGSLATTGYFHSGSQRSVGSYGRWWSSTRFDNNSAYYLSFYGSSASRDDVNKRSGYSVRCMRSS